MRETEQDQDRLTDEAIDLVIRLQNDPANPVASEMMRSWRARSPAHERAWARVARLHGAAGKVLAEHGEGAGPSRRALLLGGVLGLGALGASYALLPEILLRNRADHATGKGETRQLTLGDGTKATLGPDSAIAVDYGEARRKVEVLTGMCFFEVARETSRPFMVTAGDLEATALGTDPPPPTGPKRLLVESWPRGQRGRRSWSGLRSRPRGHGGHEDLRRGRLVSERAMWADGVEVPPPAFHDDLRLREGVEDLAVEEFIAQPGIERLDEAVLPGTARRDIGGLRANRADPFLDSLRDKFRPVI